MFGYWIAKSTFDLWVIARYLSAFFEVFVLKFCCLDVNLVHIATTYVGILCLYDKTLHSSCFPSREKTADFSYFKRLLRIASKRTISIFGRKDKLLLKRKIGHYNSKYNEKHLRS